MSERLDTSNRHEVVYVMTDAEGNEHVTTQLYEGFTDEASIRHQFWRQRLSEVFPLDVEVVGVRIDYIAER